MRATSRQLVLLLGSRHCQGASLTHVAIWATVWTAAPAQSSVLTAAPAQCSVLTAVGTSVLTNVWTLVLTAVPAQSHCHFTITALPSWNEIFMLSGLPLRLSRHAYISHWSVRLLESRNGLGVACWKMFTETKAMGTISPPFPGGPGMCRKRTNKHESLKDRAPQCRQLP
jgi:hypothetical protein